MHALEFLVREGEQGKIGKGQHTAAMHKAAAIHMLALCPKRAVHRAVSENLEKEGPALVLKGIRALPRLPTGKFTLGHRLRRVHAVLICAVHGFAPLGLSI